MAESMSKEIECILASKVVNSKVLYLVQWKNVLPEYDIWESARSVQSHVSFIGPGHIKTALPMEKNAMSSRGNTLLRELSGSSEGRDEFSLCTTSDKVAMQNSELGGRRRGRGRQWRRTAVNGRENRCQYTMQCNSKRAGEIGSTSAIDPIKGIVKTKTRVGGLVHRRRACSSVIRVMSRKRRRYPARKASVAGPEPPTAEHVMKVRQPIRRKSSSRVAKARSNMKGHPRKVAQMSSQEIPDAACVSEVPVTKSISQGVLCTLTLPASNSVTTAVNSAAAAVTNSGSSVLVGLRSRPSTSSGRTCGRKRLRVNKNTEDAASHDRLSTTMKSDTDDDNYRYSLPVMNIDDVKSQLTNITPCTVKSSKSFLATKPPDFKVPITGFYKPRTLNKSTDMKLLPCQPPNTKEVMAGYSLQPSVYLEDVEDDGLVGDLPQFFPFGGPLSPGSVSCRTLPRSLPSQLHRKKTLSRWNRRVIDASVLGSDDFGGHNRVSRSSTNSTGPKIPLCAAMPVERRFSVRSTECVFRYKQIVVKKCHRYTQIWLDSQTVVKNAINPQVVQELVSALNAAKYDDSSLVLLSSIGSFFCSGVDLHFLTRGDRLVAARQMADCVRELTKAFITFPKPVVAGVGGSAVGLGVALLCLCDVVYSSDKASFHLPYTQLAQTPEGCSSFTLPNNLGWAMANELLFGGRRVTALEACQLGLVSQVFWPTALMQEVIPRTENIASCPAKALEGTKLLMRSHLRTKMELTNEMECNLLIEHWKSDECQTAIEAYLANENNFSS